MESRPRSVLAAFQEHLQLASTKCGSLMEQLNIVRKKVEGKEAMMMNVSDPVSDDFLENVSPKIVLKSEEMDLLDHKDVLNKEQMAVGNAYVERSTGDTNFDVNKHLIIRTSSQHSEIIANKEEVPYLNGNITPNEKERYSLKFDGAANHKRSTEKLITETEKISDKAILNVIAGKGKESFNEDLSSDDESTLSSCSSDDDDDGQGDSDKQNIYEELLKRLKDNEEKKNINKSRSSSENSSSTFQKSQKTNISPKKNSSNSTVLNEFNFDKNNGDIENLNVGVDFFLPSSVTEKFQEMFYEDSGEEELNNGNKDKDKSMRVTFDDLIIGRPKKHSFVGEKHSENTSPKNRLLNETSLFTKVSPNQTNQDVPKHRQKDKVKETFCDISSVQSKSEKSKKQNTAVCSSTIMNLKLHSPEMNLYKRLNGVPLKHEIKKNGGRKDIKSKKTSIVNSKLKAKYIIPDTKLKTLPDKKNNVAINNFKNTKNEVIPPRTHVEKDGGKDVINKNKTQQKNISVSNKNVFKKSGNELLATNTPQNKVDKAKLNSDFIIKKSSLDEILNHKEEVKHANINSDSKTMVLKKNKINKAHDQGNLKENLNSDPKNMISKKNHVIKADDLGKPKEKMPQPIKNAIVKEKKPVITKSEQDRRNNMRTFTSGKELSSKNNSTNDEIPPTNVKLKNSKERVRSYTSVQLAQSNKESNKQKLLSTKGKEETFDTRNFHSFDKSSKTKETSESLKGRHHIAKETIHSQSINDMKAHTTSFPFILGQSTSKTYNVRAAIQQTMSIIMRSPAETLRRSSFSEMLNVSSKASTLKTSASYNSGRKVCPACVMRVDEEDYEQSDDNPIDPWDTEYHSKRFIRCTCMPRNTVNFKTVMNQLLQETSSSYNLPTESYQESEQENGEENRVNKVLFRKHNNIYKLSKLLQTLLKIRDLLVT